MEYIEFSLSRMNKKEKIESKEKNIQEDWMIKTHEPMKQGYE